MPDYLANQSGVKMNWPTNLCNHEAMNEDEERIQRAHDAFLEAEAERRRAIENGLRNRSVKQARIAEITGLSRETLRNWRNAAGIPPDERYVRAVSKPSAGE